MAFEGYPYTFNVLKHMIRLSLFFAGFAVLVSACVGVDKLPDEVRAVEITSSATVLFEGEQAQAEAKLVNPFGDRFGGPVTWSSSDPAIATIDEQGLILALSRGQVEVIARYEGLASNRLFVTVVADPTEVAEVLISGDQAILRPGDMSFLSASARNAAGDSIEGAVFTWRSEDPQVAAVSESGVVTALASGQTLIFAQTSNISSAGYALEVASTSLMGTFAGLNGYNVEGSVFLENGPNGPVIRLGDDFQSSNGPGLYVYLSNSANSVAGGVEVGKLRKNAGADTYELPGGVGLTTYKVVIILCKPFSIPFGSATLN